VSASLDHVTITACDLAASLAFYDAALGALGMHRVVELVDEEEDEAATEAVAYGPGDSALLWLVAGRAPTSGAHVSLRAGSAAQVEAFHAAALAHGGASHDAPRRWAIYRRGQFNAIVRDPDGNLVEAVAAEVTGR
jgi:catechol 2,3-dioxygenase-like lactoylglutathione lyase family enzyme